MAQVVLRGQVTPADELRDLLEKSEKRVANVRGCESGAVELLKDLDRIADLWPQLEAQGVDLRPETGRWETLRKSVLRYASHILAELQRCGGIKNLRAQVHPEGTEAPWWWLDTYVSDTRRRQLRRTATIGGAVVVIAVILYVLVFKVFFPVDPKVAESARQVSRGEQLVQEDNDWSGALAEFQAASRLTPGDSDVWLRLGVVQEHLGDAQAAAQSFARARSLLSSEQAFLDSRASAYLLFGLVDEADKDLQASLKIRNDDAQAWYYAAAVYEARGQLQEAVQALDKASTYAQESHQDEITALARYRMGVLMQRMAVLQPTATAAP